MSRVNRDFEVSLAGWRPGNIGSLLYRQAIRRRLVYHPAAPMSSPRLAKGQFQEYFSRNCRAASTSFFSLVATSSRQTLAADPGANPQSGFSVMRVGARY